MNDRGQRFHGERLGDKRAVRDEHTVRAGVQQAAA